MPAVWLRMLATSAEASVRAGPPAWVESRFMELALAKGREALVVGEVPSGG